MKIIEEKFLYIDKFNGLVKSFWIMKIRQKQNIKTSPCRKKLFRIQMFYLETDRIFVIISQILMHKQTHCKKYISINVKEDLK